MSTVVRFSDLVTIGGENIMEQDGNVDKVKEAVFYLDTMTESMTDEEFIEFLKSKDTAAFMDESYMRQIREDFSQNERFHFMLNDIDKIMYGILEVIPMALRQNNIIR